MEKTKEFTPALGYKSLTDFYDIAIKLTMPEKKFRNRLIDEVAPDNGEDILEFGYGTGQNLLLAIKRNTQAIYKGLDIDLKVKNIAQGKLENTGYGILLDLYDGNQFPYPNNSFDKVFSCLVFHQLDRENKIQNLNEIFRVLKPGGRFIVADWGKAQSSWMRSSFYIIQLLDGFKTTEDNVKGLLPDFISKSGFENTKEIGYLNTALGTLSYYSAIKPSQ